MKPKKIKNNGRHLKVHSLRNGEMKATLGAVTYSCGVEGSQCDTLTVNIEYQSLSHRHHTVDIIIKDSSPKDSASSAPTAL